MALSGGSASGPGFTPQALGTYCYRADYAGAGNYLGSSDASVGECFTVTEADSSTTSTPASSSIQLGDSTDDRVVVTGNRVAGTPAGDVEFSVCGPLSSKSGCATGGTSIGSVTLSGGSASSPAFTPSALGTYCYRADYAGAGDYLGSSDASAGECFTVTEAGSSTASTPADASIQLGDSTGDRVVVTGNPVAGTPSGQVEFSVCGPLSSRSGCATGGTSLGSVTLSGGSASSPAFTPSALGTYCYRADYAGAGNYLASSDGSAGECFTVTEAGSSTASTPADASIRLGDSTHDSVTVTGNSVAGTPGGDVTFSVCGPLSSASGCASGGTSLGNVALSGGSASGPDFTPQALGTYCYRAEYAKAGNYLGSSDASAGECFTVTRAPSSTSSQPAKATINLGEGDADSVTVTGTAVAGTPSASVSFSVCGPFASASGCATGGAAAGSADLGADGTAISPTFTPTAAGTYCFRADYGGDANYESSADGGRGECFTVAKSAVTSSDTPSDPTTTMAAGNTVNVVLTGLPGGPTPTGSVTFWACGPQPGPGGCPPGSGSMVGSGPVRVAAGPGSTATATSPTFKPTRAGTWCLRADYSGDANYNAFSSSSPTGCFTVAPAPPPSISIGAPVTGGRYAFGAVVRASYSCQEGSGGPGLATCAGTAATNSTLDTRTPGVHSFTVNASSIDGETASQTISYTVMPDNHFTGPSRHRKLRGSLTVLPNGTLRFNVTVPGPGTLDVLVTAWKDNLASAARLLQPALHRFVYARKHANAHRRGTVHLVVKPNGRGRRLVSHPRYRVTLRLWVTFTPTDGTQRSTGLYGLHLGT